MACPGSGQLDGGTGWEASAATGLVRPGAEAGAVAAMLCMPPDAGRTTSDAGTATGLAIAAAMARMARARRVDLGTVRLQFLRMRDAVA